MTIETIIRNLYSRGADKQAIEATIRIEAMHDMQLRKLVKKLNPYWSDAVVKMYVDEFKNEL